MIYMKILKKGGVVEKRGEEEAKSLWFDSIKTSLKANNNMLIEEQTIQFTKQVKTRVNETPHRKLKIEQHKHYFEFMS
jgi:hypothetical protein